MTWILKSKLFIAIFCLALAIVLAFVIAPAYVKAQYELVDVVILSKSIAANTLLTEASVKTTKMRAVDIPANAITDDKELIGMYSAVPIFDGDFITPEKLASDDCYNNYLLHIRDEKTAIAVALPKLSSSLAGQIAPGDTVSVVAYDQQSNQVLDHEDLRYIAVADVVNDKGESINQIGLGALSAVTSAMSSRESIPAAVILLCTYEQSLKLVQLENQGKIHLILRGRGDEEQPLLEGNGQ